ncbi:MAG: histidine phosphatase family protein [Anaerolineales bacterium]|nr:histidine phosphatase family protein [Anaerolineales bacterium]
MPLLLLIRHGENDYVKTQRAAGRLPGVHLNARGAAQAAALAFALAKTKLAAVYSSPLERAMETAAPLAAAHGLRVQKRRDLQETDLGDWQGRLLKDMRREKSWKILQQTPSRFRFPGGESVPEQQLRLVNEVERICAAHGPKEAVVCVSHADPIKLVIAHYLGLPLDQYQKLSIDTASVSTLFIGEKGARLLNLNWKPVTGN